MGHEYRSFIFQCLLSLMFACSACTDDNTSDNQDSTLCPSTAPAGMELCVSFSKLHQGLADIGDVQLEIQGDAQTTEGREGIAVQLDGVDDAVSVKGFSFESDQLTVEAWVKPEQEQVQWATVVDYWASSQGFWLGASDVPGGWEFWSGSDFIGDEDGLVQAKWQHLAGVLDATSDEIKLYVNGMEMSRISGIDAFAKPSDLELTIGGKGDRSDYFHGIIDEIQVWSTARTPEQICTDAGGSWTEDGCSYSQPVGNPPSPCVNIDCSGHGTCSVQSAGAVCSCQDGYHAQGLECIEDYDPCNNIQDKITEWNDWFVSSLEPGLEQEVQSFVDDWEPGNPAWNPDAEAWTAAAMLGLLYNSQEVFCLGVLKAVNYDPQNPVALANAASCMLELGWGDDARRFLDCSLDRAPNDAATLAGQAYHEYNYNNDTQAALEKLEQAISKDPSNPEWSYQALQLAIELGDMGSAESFLSNLPSPEQGLPNGWRGAVPTSEPDQQERTVQPRV